MLKSRRFKNYPKVLISAARSALTRIVGIINFKRADKLDLHAGPPLSAKDLLGPVATSYKTASIRLYDGATCDLVPLNSIGSTFTVIKRRIALLSLLAVGLAWVVLPITASAQPVWDAKILVERKLAALPPGELYWQVESFPTTTQAKAVATDASLVAESAGKAWLFTLAGKGASFGGTKVAEIGPVPAIAAPSYLLRVQEAGGPPGATTPVHSHPGSESFFVLSGTLRDKTQFGTMEVGSSKAMQGHGSDTIMQASSAGPGNLTALVLFVLDATKPFSTPASFN